MATTSPLRQRIIDDMTIRNLSRATQQSYNYAAGVLLNCAVIEPKKDGRTRHQVVEVTERKSVRLRCPRQALAKRSPAPVKSHRLNPLVFRFMPATVPR